MDNKHLHLVPTGLLSAYVLKQLVFGTSVSEMGVTFALTAAVVAYEYLSRSRKVAELEQVLTKKVESQDTVIRKQNEVIEEMAKEFAKVRDSVQGLRIAQNSGSLTGLTRTK